MKKSCKQYNRRKRNKNKYFILFSVCFLFSTNLFAQVVENSVSILIEPIKEKGELQLSFINHSDSIVHLSWFEYMPYMIIGEDIKFDVYFNSDSTTRILKVADNHFFPNQELKKIMINPKGSFTMLIDLKILFKDNELNLYSAESKDYLYVKYAFDKYELISNRVFW